MPLLRRHPRTGLLRPSRWGAGLVVVVAALGLGSPAGHAQIRNPVAPAPRAPAGTEASTRASGTFAVGLPINPWELEGSALDAALDQAVAAGVSVVQAPADWPVLCPTATTCDDGQLDRLVREANARHLAVALQVSQTPDWVHPQAVGTSDVRAWTPPTGPSQLASFTAFVAGLSARYAGRVRSYEIWNEPDLVASFEPAVDPASYALLLRAGWTGVRSGDPSALVVSGGLARGDLDYLRRLYAALAALPGAASHRYYSDLVGLHPYSGAAAPDWVDGPGALTGHDTSYAAIRTVEAVLAAAGDKGKQLWIGEYGFSTQDTWMRAVPDQRRAVYLMRALDLAAADPDVAGLVWYAFRPTSTTSTAWAITSDDGTGSTTFTALAAWTLARSRTGSGPAAGAPRVRLAGLGTHASARAPDALTLTGMQTVGAAQAGASPSATDGMDLWVDGILVASSADATLSWDTDDVPAGPHTMVLAAYQRDGSAPRCTAPMAIAVAHDRSPQLALDALTLPAGAAPGASVSVTATVSSPVAVMADDLVVAVRAVGTETAEDFPGLTQVLIGPAGFTWTSSRTFPAGTYTVFAAAHIGGTWIDLAPPATLVVGPDLTGSAAAR